jgi:hypothetical protein
VDPVRSSIVLTPEERTELTSRASGTKHGERIELSSGLTVFRVDALNEEGRECYPETQLAVALMLKGVANVAEVFRVEGVDDKPYFFSRGMDVGSVAEAGEGALGLQQILLDTLFGDSDHHVMTSDGKAIEDTGMNVRTSEDFRKFYFFDFGMAFDEAFLTGKTYSRPYAISRLAFVNQSESHKSQYLEMLRDLRERFSGKEGLRFISAAVDRAGAPMRKLFAYNTFLRYDALMHGGFERYFRSEMIRRITFMEQYLQKTPVAAQNAFYE